MKLRKNSGIPFISAQNSQDSTAHCLNISTYMPDYKEKQGNDNPEFRVVVFPREKPHDVMEWHIGALRGAQNTLSLILGGGFMVVHFTVTHHILYTCYNYSFVTNQFLMKTITNKSGTYPILTYSKFVSSTVCASVLLLDFFTDFHV